MPDSTSPPLDKEKKLLATCDLIDLLHDQEQVSLSPEMRHELGKISSEVCAPNLDKVLQEQGYDPTAWDFFETKAKMEEAREKRLEKVVKELEEHYP